MAALISPVISSASPASARTLSPRSLSAPSPAGGNTLTAAPPQGESLRPGLQGPDPDAPGRRQIQDLPPGHPVLRLRRDQEGLYLHPGEQSFHAVDVIGVKVGQDQIVQPTVAQGQQIVGGDGPGIVPAVGTAAVHQGGPFSPGEQDALALAHVQRQNLQLSGKAIRSQADRHRQRNGRQAAARAYFRRPPFPVQAVKNSP